jgi:hypothetical protein
MEKGTDLPRRTITSPGGNHRYQHCEDQNADHDSPDHFRCVKMTPDLNTDTRGLRSEQRSSKKMNSTGDRAV